MAIGNSTGDLVKIATYNIHRCIGTDGVHDVDRVAAVLDDLDADIVGLQEVSRRDAPSGIDQGDYLARRCGYEYVHGPTFSVGGSALGNGLLSRGVLNGVRFLDLSFRGREPRAAIDARIGTGRNAIEVFVTHLGLSIRERRWQSRALAAALAARRDEGPQVLMGDLNDWVPRSGSIRELRRMAAVSPNPPASFPSRFPCFALDRIWVMAGPRLSSLRAVRTPLTRVASDHLPLLATLPVRGAGAGRSAAAGVDDVTC